MNHASLKSAKRWQKLGLFHDSEFVYCTYLRGHNYHTEVITREKNYGGGTKIYPAPNCEEMGDYLYNFTNICVTREGDNLYCFGNTWDDIPHKVDVVCKNETEAREKAINWYLDQKESK